MYLIVFLFICIKKTDSIWIFGCKDRVRVEFLPILVCSSFIRYKISIRNCAFITQHCSMWDPDRLLSGVTDPEISPTHPPPRPPSLCLYKALQFLAFNLRSQRILLLLYKPTWDSWHVYLGWDLAQKGESCAPSQTLSLCSFLREPSPIFSLPSGQFFISFYSLQKYSLIYLCICLFLYGL